MSATRTARRPYFRPTRASVMLAGVLIAIVALAACATPMPPDTEPIIRGVIVEITSGEQGGAVRVVWHESLGEMFDLDAIDVRIDEGTEVFDREGALIGFVDLAVRDVVDVWVSGPIAESYPPQGTADAVRVIGEFDEIRPLPVPFGLIEP